MFTLKLYTDMHLGPDPPGAAILFLGQWLSDLLRVPYTLPFIVETCDYLLPGPEAPDTGLPLEGDRSTGAACGFAFSAIPLGCASSSSSRSSTAGAGASSCRRTKSQSFRVIDLEVLN